MASPLVFLHRVLGFAAVRRGRTLSGESPQHNGERFRNVAPRPVEGFGKTLGIAWNMLVNKPRNTVPTGALPVDSLTREQLDAAPDRSLYRLGHSTLLLKLRGEFWLTDPVFAERASPFRRVGPKRFHAPPIALEDLPPLRGVILSHDHYDHLDRDTVLALAATTGVFVTTLGVGDRLIEWGIDAKKVRQLDWWQSIDIDGLTLTATPAQHFSGRSLFDGNSTLWASWVIVADDLRVFFSGDTGYFDGFRTIGERLGPFDVTLIETGAYDPQWPYVHMQPEETVQAHIDLRGRTLIPIHNGTFDLAMHRWQEPFERVTALAMVRGVELSTPRMGERLDLTEPHRGERWWRTVDDAEKAQAAKPRRWQLCASETTK
ncbi:beta-lactamase superfamily domain protein [Burkholderia ambifaria AMMD]|jgi:L-ascorbate metabolism protein UlaG (beta-lactamase superfamily)|uniref:Zn-dependent hydrolase of the beta-lactamase fold-like protein n=1 Tax=Burkholderia ambifaria (strain ATCC BAA-244 / DSM 16087 / CCUG 44356 / LMG 19182 / AMMD) TaxID=339670 RepID=Q0B2S5_BURCM|nr:MBL fold metallo-hydrolase [Burkholderia ambifaria]ABI91548.1 Zn-dependent hydrolase of the beta-lactamase fold-like protein [Burkholderia ambifaria AMMD]AJY26800.1 beta-lactamase superfamily domain protein [Burkholderia ambifaria AMMD]MBR7933292.1 MBL fold metallo-hydrolase [Burkholderia ambifaria]PEH70558.1 hydrolase [Burkholderia ambifaria]QQC09184.1 MBL fold metallo-hydrolase [Burkholderia ambifaria]